MPLPPHPAHLGARLSALHAANFLGIGVYMSFFPVWLQSKGMSATTIGIVLALPIVVRILTTPALMALVDRRIDARALLIASHGAQVVGYPLLLLIDNPVLIAAMVGLMAAAQSSIGPANELVTANALRERRSLNYGRIRVWGSVAFLFASIAAGYLIGAVGPQVVVLGLGLAPVLGIMATLAAIPAGSGGLPGKPREKPAATGLRLPAILWVAIAAAATTHASHAALYSFGSIHWLKLGFSDEMVGLLWAAGVLSEIAVFYWLGGLVGRGNAGFSLLAAGGLTAILRFGILSLDPGLGVTFFVQALHGLSFGATHLGAMALLAALAPPGARGRAQGIYAAAVSVGLAGATIVSGSIYREAGPFVFAALLPLAVIGFGLALFGLRAARARPADQPQSAGEGG